MAGPRVACPTAHCPRPPPDFFPVIKAVICRRHGGPDVLEYTDVPDPSAGPGQILVRVKACALNHLDLWIRQGIPAYSIQMPHISCCDVAGVVERVGQGVTHIAVGDSVVLAPGLSCGECDWCRAGEGQDARFAASRGG